jgi:hypothetical protein
MPDAFGPSSTRIFLDLCVSSLREGHANLLCIVPILTDVAEVYRMSMLLAGGHT